MVQLLPEQLLGHAGLAHAVGMRQGVGTGTSSPSNRRKRAAKKFERIANVVEAQRMSQLRIEHCHYMAPGREGARLLVHTSLLGHFADQEGRNKIANLAQDLEFVRALDWFCIFFHLLLVAQIQNLFQRFFL